MAISDCIDSIRRAAGDITDEEAHAMLDELDLQRERLAAEGRVANLDEQLRSFGRDAADREHRAAILQRRQAAINIVVRDRNNDLIEQHVTAGLSRPQAVLALLEGTVRGVRSARKSVAATTMAFEDRYLGPIFAAIAKERPHLDRLLSLPMIPGRRAGRAALLVDVTREMHRPAGAGRATKNADAHFLSDRFQEVLELSRRDLHRLGADIGKLDDYLPHVHDDYRVMQVESEEWAAAILPELALERSFPNLMIGEVRGILDDIYNTIISGRRDAPTAVERGEFTGPANLTRRLGGGLVLRFRDADAWLRYNQRFGYGDMLTAMVEHLKRASQMAGQIEVLGPNPEVMLKSILGEQQLLVRHDGALSARQRARMVSQLSIEDAPNLGIGGAWREVSGFTLRPANVTVARIASSIRLLQSMAKLGEASINSASDIVLKVANQTYRGVPIGEAWARTIGGMFQGRGASDQQAMSFLLSEGFDGLIGHIMTPYAALDTAPGAISRLTTRFFRLSGLTWWTDVSRAVSVRLLAADMGRFAETAWPELPQRYRHVFEQHGIGDTLWNALRQATWTGQNGTRYVLPDQIARLSDDVIEGTFGPETADARKRMTDIAFNRWLSSRRERARLDLELAYSRMIADESRFGILGGDDPATRRLATLGSRPGTLAGEAVRFIIQFKHFPLAFTRRIIGRGAFGGMNGRGKFAPDLPHIGHLITGLMIAGFGAMTAKAASKGFRPRDPREWQTILAAALQPGGAGIYGDFLFAQVSRFGNSLLEAAAGPTTGMITQALSLWADLRNGEPRASRLLNTELGNTPFINLWYTRPALDWLVLHTLRDSVSPGFLRRQERRRQERLGQERILPSMAR